MIMMFLLVVVVDNVSLNEQFFFRRIDHCNFYAQMIESGRYKMNQGSRSTKQKNITSYCIPKYAPQGTKTWD